MNYTQDQLEFIQGVKDFIYEDLPRKDYISLQGGAGSGKSTVVTSLPKLIKDRYFVFVAYTGKAVDNLMKSGVQAQTIYSTFYNVDPTATDLKFLLKHSVELPTDTIVIVDEVSMLSQQMFNDICSFGYKVIAVGDRNQLGPVKAQVNKILNNPDYELKVIHRQVETSGITRLAKEYSTHHTLPSYGQYSDDVTVISRNEVTTEMILSVDQAICGTNSTREKWNSIIRRAYNRYDYFPEKGERVICCRNTKIDVDNRRVINGTTGTVSKLKLKGHNELLMSFRPDWSERDVVLRVDGENFITGQIGNIPLGKTAFEFAYVITVNKAQGSEWDNVLFIVDDNIPGESFYRNVLTGITRAKKKLILAY